MLVSPTCWIRPCLDAAPGGEAVLTILDDKGNKIDSFSSVMPEEKKDRHGQYISANAGMNSFWWTMNHASGPKMVDSDFHERPAGPLVLPGAYTARLSVGDWSMEQGFNLVKDPRVKTSQRDLKAQLDLMIDVQNKLSEIIEAVNTSRGVKKRMADWTGRLAGNADADKVTAAMARLEKKLDKVEAALVQKELTSFGDVLNYREMLFEKINGLPPVIRSADAKPTQQSYDVFEKLSGQADTQLAAMQALVDGDLAKINNQLSELGVEIIGG